MNKPERQVVFVLKIEADNRHALASALYNIATHVDREEITSKGCSGGCDSGYLYEYRESAGPSHDEYFVQLDAYLEQIRSVEQQSGDGNV